MSVMGTQVRSVADVSTAVEARLAFTSRWQAFGLATDLNTGPGNSWAIIGTKGTADTLYARTNVNGATQTVEIGATPTGLHTYRVEPVAGGFNFYIDGVKVASIAQVIAAGTPLKLVLSDMVAVAPLSVDWAHAVTASVTSTSATSILAGSPAGTTSSGVTSAVLTA